MINLPVKNEFYRVQTSIVWMSDDYAEDRRWSLYTNEYCTVNVIELMNKSNQNPINWNWCKNMGEERTWKRIDFWVGVKWIRRIDGHTQLTNDVLMRVRYRYFDFFIFFPEESRNKIISGYCGFITHTTTEVKWPVFYVFLPPKKRKYLGNWGSERKMRIWLVRS